MYRSNYYGRMFWVDDNNDFKSCPLNVDNTGDFDAADYLSLIHISEPTRPY